MCLGAKIADALQIMTGKKTLSQLLVNKLSQLSLA
jgi:hypothetical protein